ncbi:MAG: hypothetical protein ABL879_17875 [Devosia sp.]
MTQLDIHTLEHSARTAMAWSPEGFDGQVHYRAVLGALVPAIGILALAATFLLAAF